MKKERGLFLTIMLVLVSFSALIEGYSLITSNVFGSLVNNPSNGADYLELFLSLAPIIYVIGLWMWKKWAVYLFLITSLIALAMFIMGESEFSFIALLSGLGAELLVIILCFLAIRKKWQFFN